MSSLYYRLWRIWKSSSLSPRLCLQECHLFADGSSWTLGFSKRCMAAAWVASCLTSSSTWLRRGPLWNEFFFFFGLFAIKTELPFSFLCLVYMSISRPPDPALPFLFVPSVCVLSFGPLWQKIKGGLCCVNIAGSRRSIVKLGWDGKNEPKQIKAGILYHSH